MNLKNFGFGFTQKGLKLAITNIRKRSGVTSRSFILASTIDSNIGAKIRLKACIKEGLIKAFGDVVADTDPTVETASKPEFGDYQCNIAMPLAKKLKMKPVDVATKLINSMETDILSQLDIAGPGFINMRLSEAFIKNELKAKLEDPSRLNIPTLKSPQRIIIDFSSPNIAKEMHV
eukprot:gene41317-54759_t